MNYCFLLDVKIPFGLRDISVLSMGFKSPNIKNESDWSGE